MSPHDEQPASAARVKLTPLRSADLETLFAWINDRELVVLSAPFEPVHEPDHRAWFDAIRRRTDVVVFGIRSMPTDELIGSCQLTRIDRRHRTAELQIRIGPANARGHGAGTEAVRLLLLHAFQDLDVHRVQLHVLATNLPAIRAYEKAGFRREGVLREAAYIAGRRIDLVVMGVLRDEAAAAEP
jgi:RimJ/RimL family protein N-acetyltransferase